MIFWKASEYTELLFYLALKEVESTKHFYGLVSELDVTNVGSLNGGKGCPREYSDDSPWYTFMKGSCPTKEEIKEFLNIMGVRRRKHFIVKSPESLSLKIYAGKVTGVPAGANSDPP